MKTIKKPAITAESLLEPIAKICKEHKSGTLIALEAVDRYYDLGDRVKMKAASTILKETPSLRITLDDQESLNYLSGFINHEHKKARIKAAAIELANSLDEADRRIRALFIDYMRAKSNVS